jgi:steroid delta-isomerase-like uncharacterized protein
MRRVFIFGLVCALQSGCAQIPQMQTTKQTAILWYDAFTTKNLKILESILGPEWQDIPAPPNTPRGVAGVKPVFESLTTAFPDLAVVPQDVLVDGNKVTVRSRITGTQHAEFAGVASNGRRLDIQAIDIHEVENGKIVRTWHTEDWMTGLRQLKGANQ